MPLTGKADKQRRVSIGHKTILAVKRNLRKRAERADWLWLGSAEMPLVINSLRVRLVRRFKDAGVKFRGPSWPYEWRELFGPG